MLTINEVFYSVQGESSRAGLPCVFVRLTSCDLRCSWCDTTYAFHEGKSLTVDQVVEEVQKHECDLVEITGGEPLLQDDVYPLMDRLLALGRTVLLETGGHRPTGLVPPAVVKILDVKCPASGESDRNEWTNLAQLNEHDEVKFVIQDRADYDYATDVIERHRLVGRCASILFSPVHGVLSPRVLSEWMLSDQSRARLQLQVHKYIWSPQTRGV
jgi:7-carboxy-7-deazaguanine synthase